MRKKFIYVVLVPLVVISVVLYLFLNRWIESGIEYAAEEVVGAKVEIDNLQLTLSPLGIEWEAMQVANPGNTWENLFETDKVKFSMEFAQLLRGKYIIDLMEIDNIIIGTKRETDGAIDPERNKRAILAGGTPGFSAMADQAFKNVVALPPVFDLVKLRKGFNADSLIKALDLKTLKVIDTVKTELDNFSNQWTTIKNDFETEKSKVLKLEEQVKAINSSQLNNPQSITDAISIIDKAQGSLKEISQLVTTRSADVQKNIKEMYASAGLIDNYVSDDFNRLKSMARLPSINTGGMAQLLVGNEMYKRAGKYLYWIDEARSTIKTYQPEPEEDPAPPRMKGQDIAFPTERSYPKFWIKEIKISGSSDSTQTKYINVKGNAENVSENQKLSGKPLTVSLQGIENNKRSLKISGLFDRIKDVPYDEINAELAGVPVGEFSLGNSNFLPSKVTDAVMKTSLQIKVPGDKFDLNVDFNLQNVVLNYESEPKNLVEKLVREVLSGINSFDVKLRMWNTSGKLDVALATDLDEKLTQKVLSVVGDEINKLKSELQRKFDSFVQTKIQEFEKLYQSKLDEVKSQLGIYQTLVTDQLSFVDAKKQELMQQLQKQQQGAVGDKLKGLFKKP